jgi:dihydrolipoamide dehydrogenase
MAANSYDYDLLVIGSGPAGQRAAIQAAKLEKKVAVVERKAVLGGVSVNLGTIPSKTLREAVMDLSGYREREFYGASYSVKQNITMADLLLRTDKVIRHEIEVTKHQLIRNGIDLIAASASFAGPDLVQLDYVDGSMTRRIRCRNIMIASGTEVTKNASIPFDGRCIFTSDDVLYLDRLPKTLAVIGAGVIGCEYATIFSNFHQTKVHLLDRQPRVLPNEDEDISDFVNTNLTARGVEVHHNAIMRKIIHHDDFLEVVVDYDGGRTQVLEVDVALVSVGRIPNLDKLGLENVGIRINSRGALDTDTDCRVKGNIFAVGDVTQHSALYNVAEMEGRYAVKSMYLKNKYPLRYSNMSTIMFFNPEVAAVGLNETQCRANHIPHQVAYYSNALLNRAIAMRSTNGFVKILVSDDGADRILGMRAAGPQASNTIMVIAHLMDQDKGVTDIMKSIHPHPSITEGIQECLRLLVNKSIFKPQVFPDFMKIRKWRPE